MHCRDKQWAGSQEEWGRAIQGVSHRRRASHCNRDCFFNCQGQERSTLKRPQIALPAVARGNLHAWFINGLQLHVGRPQLPKVFGVWTGVGEKVICKIKTSTHTCKFYNTKRAIWINKGDPSEDARSKGRKLQILPSICRIHWVVLSDSVFVKANAESVLSHT